METKRELSELSKEEGRGGWLAKEKWKEEKEKPDAICLEIVRGIQPGVVLVFGDSTHKASQELDLSRREPFQKVVGDVLDPKGPPSRAAFPERNCDESLGKVGDPVMRWPFEDVPRLRSTKYSYGSEDVSMDDGESEEGHHLRRGNGFFQERMDHSKKATAKDDGGERRDPVFFDESGEEEESFQVQLERISLHDKAIPVEQSKEGFELLSLLAELEESSSIPLLPYLLRPHLQNVVENRRRRREVELLGGEEDSV